MRAILLALAILAFTVGCGGSDEASEGTTTTPASGECESVDAPEPREPQSKEAPTEPLVDGTDYMLAFETSCGPFTITLDPKLAPNTAASLVALANDGYFDDTIFHLLCQAS